MPPPSNSRSSRNSRKVAQTRRGYARFPEAAVPFLRSIKLVAGPEVRLLNISRGGALIEGEARLSPGSSLSLRVVTADAVYHLRAKVIRSRAASLVGSAIQYQTAVVFDEEFTLIPAGKREQDAAKTGLRQGAGALHQPRVGPDGRDSVPSIPAETPAMVALDFLDLEPDLGPSRTTDGNDW